MTALVKGVKTGGEDFSGFINDLLGQITLSFSSISDNYNCCRTCENVALVNSVCAIS